MARLKFKQTAKQFLSSKTNILGLTSVASGVAGYYTDALGPIESIQAIGAGLGLLFVKDAIIGANEHGKGQP